MTTRAESPDNVLHMHVLHTFKYSSVIIAVHCFYNPTLITDSVRENIRVNAKVPSGIPCSKLGFLSEGRMFNGVNAKFPGVIFASIGVDCVTFEVRERSSTSTCFRRTSASIGVDVARFVTVRTVRFAATIDDLRLDRR